MPFESRRSATKRAVAVFLALGISTAALLSAQELGMQTGTWEFKMTGFPMDGVPPNMRAMMEAEMSKPFRSCVTAEDVRNLKFGRTNDDNDEDCKVVSSTLTRTGGQVVRQCEGDEPSTQTLHIEAPSPRTVRATITRKTAAASNTMTVTGQWVAAQCADR